MTAQSRRLRTALAHLTACLSDCEHALPPSPANYRVIAALKDARVQILAEATRLAHEEAAR